LISKTFLSLLRCPHCAKTKEGKLALESDQFLICQERDCNRRYPIHEGLPIMVTPEGDFLGYRKKIMSEMTGVNESE
jgi:uncharacterized protein YbaR (Trm112 family)